MDSQISQKQVQCYTCLKIMRSDHLQRHLDSKHADMEKPGVKEKLLIDNELYYKNVEVGKYVFDIVTSGDIEQQPLSKDHAYSLNLYNKMRPIIDVESAELRLWQKQYLQLVDILVVSKTSYLD